MERRGVAGARGRREIGCTRPCRFMRCTQGPGGEREDEALPLADLSRTRGGVASVRKESGIHAYRADANHGASIRRLMGVPDRWLLWGDQPLRNPRGFHVFCRSMPPGRTGRDSRTGPGAFPARRPRTGVLRWNASVRTCGPLGRANIRIGAPSFSITGATRYGNFLLSNALFLGEQISHRLPARGCGGVDALP